MRFKNWFNENWGFVPGSSLNQTSDITNNNLGIRSKYISSDCEKQRKVKKANFGFKKEKNV